MLFVQAARKSPASREDRCRAFVSAASQTAIYRDTIGVRTAPLEQWLTSLPVIELEQYDQRKSAFHNPRAGVRSANELRYPLSPMPRIAVLVDGFRPTKKVRIFADFDLAEIVALDQETVAGTISMMQKLARTGKVLRYPPIVFSSIREGCVTEADRNLFWKSLGVPVFEQLLGLDGEVLAEECEARDGLHVRSEDAIVELRARELLVTSLNNLEYPVFRLATGLTGSIETGLCSCGKSGTRLVGLARQQRAKYAAAG